MRALVRESRAVARFDPAPSFIEAAVEGLNNARAAVLAARRTQRVPANNFRPVLFLVARSHQRRALLADPHLLQVDQLLLDLVALRDHGGEVLVEQRRALELVQV